MLGCESASKPRPQPSAKLVPSAALLGSSMTWCPEEFMQGAQPGRSTSQTCFGAPHVFTKSAEETKQRRRFRLMVNFTLLSVVVLLSLTLMLLVLPVILPPLPPPPPFLMLVPVVIFILLMLIAFVPSGFNAIVVSPHLDGVNKRTSVTTGVKDRDADQHSFASNSHSPHQGNFNETARSRSPDAK